MSKQKLTLSIDSEVVKTLKKAAIDREITLSDFLSQTALASIVKPTNLKSSEINKINMLEEGYK